MHLYSSDGLLQPTSFLLLVAMPFEFFQTCLEVLLCVQGILLYLYVAELSTKEVTASFGMHD